MTTKPLADHGTRACYLRGCRQPECAAAHRRYCKQYDLRRLTNGPVRVDAQPVIERLRTLTAAGWSQGAIAESAGSDSGNISMILSGHFRRVHPKTARSILAIPADASPKNYWVDPTGTIRRVQALAAIGWPVRRTAADVGMSESGMRHLINGHHSNAQRSIALAVANLYESRSTVPGPSPEAAGWARKFGWPDPTYWEDTGAIDDPTHDPHALEPARTRIEQIAEDADWLLRAGHDIDHIANRLGVTRSYINKALAHQRNNRTEERTAA